MKTLRKSAGLKWTLVFFLAMMIVACKKDYIDQGIFAVKSRDFLSSDDYSKLEIQVVYVNGHQPTQSGLNIVTTMLRDRLNKPSGIFISYKEIDSPRRTTFTTQDLIDLEKDTRDRFTKRKTLTTYVFFADAPYSQDGVLGVAYGTTSIAVFESDIENYSGGISQPPQDILEATVIEHEFGHLFGLVDNGTGMKNAHLDMAHPKHCTDHNCLMYYSVETTDFLSNLTGGHVPEFDTYCIADLQGNGGK